MVQECGSGFQIATCRIPDSATCRLKSETPIASSCPKAPVCGTGGFPHLIPPNLPPQHLPHPVCFGLQNPCACPGTTLHFIIPHDCPLLPWTPTHPNPVHPSGSRQTPQAEHGQCLGPSRNDTLPGGRDLTLLISAFFKWLLLKSCCDPTYPILWHFQPIWAVTNEIS